MSLLSRLAKIDRVISQKADRIFNRLTNEELETFVNMHEHAMGLFLPKMIARTPAECALVEKIAADSKILAALFFEMK